MGQPSPFKPPRCIKASFHISKNRYNFPTTSGFRMKISMKQVYQNMAIFSNFLPTTNRLHLLQVENCDSNSRLVINEDDYSKFRLERVKATMRRMTYDIYLSGNPSHTMEVLRLVFSPYVRF